jgi:hypothetical protein
MPFQVSPGVNVSEIDLTTVVPAVSSTEGAFAGVFRWGPVGKATLIDSESKLVDRYGKPTNFNAETFFTAANFLSYGNKLYIARAANTSDATGANGALTAYANVGAVTSNTNLVVKNDDDFTDATVTTNLAAETNVRFVARYPGEMGNSLRISVCDTDATFFSNTSLSGADANISSNAQLTTIVANTGSNTFTINIGQSGTGTIAEAVSRATTIKALLSVGDLVVLGNTTTGTQLVKVTSIGNITNTATQATVTVNVATNYTLTTVGGESVANVNTIDTGYLKRYWEYAFNVERTIGTSNYVQNFGNSSAKDEIHVVVADENGKFTGTPGAVLEVYAGASRATDAKTEDGATNYIRTLINQNSKYVYYNVDRASGYTNTAIAIASTATNTPLSLSFNNGSDGLDEANVAVGVLTTGYDLFASSEEIDISLILQGKARGGVAETSTTAATSLVQLANYIISNVAETRKDCVAFITPNKFATVQVSAGNEYEKVAAYRAAVTSSTYAVIDSGYKYQYDKYNDVYRYVPLNGDIAGLCVLTDNVRDPWFSPAGFNRGIIKNVIKLAYNPSKAERDILYKAGVNPVVSFPGQGTILYGDKTASAKSSAFDRINVRRLFIVLEKAISTAAKFALFEFNDDFTRGEFKNLVEPFLRDVQGRGGILEFKVVCDTTNNTAGVIDRNEFVGDIYIKPNKSINFIQLNFVAVRTGVEFSEIVGRF